MRRRGAAPPRLAALVAAVAALGAPAAKAQDDGPRVYQLAPVGAKTLTAFWVMKRGIERPEQGSNGPGSNIDTNIVVLRYAQTLDFAGRALTPFLIVPVGDVQPTGAPGSSGLGDAQIGATLGLVGTPALSRAGFATFQARPLGAAVLARLFLPTGDYSASKPVNLGANRVAYQIGLPTVFVFSETYGDPRLTAWEILPTLTFYGPNTDPFGGARTSKEMLFSVESHLTHNLSRRVWMSADLLYRRGGKTRTDGLSNDDATRGWSVGGSFALPLGKGVNAILTYQHVVRRRDDGPDGWFFRTALVAPF